MKGGANIIGSVHALKQAHDHLISFRNEHPGNAFQKLYTHRVRSRLREMFNVISMKGEDQRK